MPAAAQALIQEGRELRNQGEFQQARSLLEKAVPAARRARSRRLEADALNVLATVQHALGDSSGAMKSFHAALTLRQALGDLPGVASVRNNLGRLATETSDYPLALEHLLEASRIYEELRETHDLLRVLTNTARLFIELHDYPQAAQHATRGLALVAEHPDEEVRAMLTNNLADAHRNLEQYESAERLFQDVLAWGVESAVIPALHGLALTLCSLGQFEDAVRFMTQAEQAAVATGDVDSQIMTTLGLAQLHRHSLPALCSHLAKAALELAERSDRPRARLNAHDLIAQTLREHDPALAYAHLDAARTLERQLNQLDSARRLENARVLFEVETLRQEADLQTTLKDTALQAKEAAEAEVHERTRQLEQLALYDPLTDLPNRALFHDRLQRQAQHGHHLIVGLLDLDRFKQVNDSLGYQAGDDLLRLVAQRLASLTSLEDTLARMAGDEFLVILRDDRHKRLETFMERVNEAFGKRFTLGTHDVFVRPSCGFAMYPEHGTDTTELLQYAEQAMYHAKHEGLGFSVYNPDLARSSTPVALDTALRQALGRQEFIVHYQPLIELKTGRIRGAEALLRWNRPGEGLVPPADFIPYAEDSGLILSIGEWVLREACHDAARSAGGMVAVNISARQFQQSGFTQLVRDALQDSGLSPERLELEITESLLMRSPELATEILRELKRLGVRVSIDDFGTGYSSLAYLKRFPLDTLKIDRSFVMDLAPEQRHESDAVIIRAIVSLGQNLGLNVVAEGVETDFQLAFLQGLGCEYAQGWRLGRPTPGYPAVT